MVQLMKAAALGAMLMTSTFAHRFEVFENADCTSNKYSIAIDTVPDADLPCREFPPKFKDDKFRSVRFSKMNTCRFRFADGFDQCSAETFKNTFDAGAENVCIQIPDSWTSMNVIGCPAAPPSSTKMHLVTKPQVSVRRW